MNKILKNSLDWLLSPAKINRTATVRAVERLSAITHLTASSEYIYSHRYLDKDNINDPRVIGEVAELLPPKLLSVIYSKKFILGAEVIRAGSALTLLLSKNNKVNLVANSSLFLTKMFLYPVQRFGTDGSDQVSFHAQLSCGVARFGILRKKNVLVDASLTYFAYQGVLSYLVSGWVKLFGADWRNGSALPGILRTKNYGSKHAWEFFERYPHLAKLVSSSVLFFECTFVAAILFRGKLSKVYCLWALMFHTANASTMGLGRFLTSFASMHPAILYVVANMKKSEGLRKLAREYASALMLAAV